MKQTLKLLICFILIASTLMLGACKKDTASDQGSKDVSAEASSESSEDTLHDESIVGTWYVFEYSIMLKAGGEGVYCIDGELIPFSWESKEGKISFTCENESVSLPEEAKYSLSEDGKSLTLGDTVYMNAPVEFKEDVDPNLVGTWYSYDYSGEEITVFNADGTGSITSGGMETSITWFVKDGVLTLSIDMEGIEIEDMQADSYKVEGDMLYITLMGEEGTFTKERKELGGNKELVGTWIEHDAPVYGEDIVDYHYSIQFCSDGTGWYTYKMDAYTFIWVEKDGVIDFTIYLELYTEDHNFDNDVSEATATYTISEDRVLTITYGETVQEYDFHREEVIEEEYIPEIEVDTEHELGGDEALVGDWVMSERDELVITFKEDGTAYVDNSVYEDVEFYWYVEDYFLVVYREVLGVADPYTYGAYKMDGDSFTLNHGGIFQEYARVNTDAGYYALTVAKLDEDDPLLSDEIFIDESIIYYGDGVDIIAFGISGVKDIKFNSYVRSDGYRDQYFQTNTLYEVGEMGDHTYFIAYTVLEDGVSDKGVSFTTPKGDTVHLVVYYNADKDRVEFSNITSYAPNN